jgi:hypothetical protein
MAAKSHFIQRRLRTPLSDQALVDQPTLYEGLDSALGQSRGREGCPCL